MPWHVGRSDGCPDSKPWAAIRDADGEVEGCHATEKAAKRQVAALYASEEKQVKGDTVELKMNMKAASTATEQGTFSAIAAAYTLDRDGERIRPGAFGNTIKAWQDRDRPIPLHWAHKGDPENVIGKIDPYSMKETDDGLYVEGQLDLDGSGLAKEAWRLMKADTVSLSFGFLGEVTPKAKDGTREIVDIDLYEISVTPAPANPDTRFLSLKARKELVSDIRQQLDEAGADRFGGDKTHVYVEDFDPDEGWAVFCVSSPNTYKYFKVGYTKQAEGVALKDGQTEVERRTQYQKKAEETDKGASRSVDPLREASRKAVADIRLDGVPRRKSPPTSEPKPAPPSERELRRRFREEMTELLRTGVGT